MRGQQDAVTVAAGMDSVIALADLGPVLGTLALPTIVFVLETKSA